MNFIREIQERDGALPKVTNALIDLSYHIAAAMQVYMTVQLLVGRCTFQG